MKELAQSVKHSKPLLSLLELKRQSVSFCIWKSIDRFEEGAQGKTDFDLLIAASNIEQAFKILRDIGWIELRAEPWRFYPEVYDFLLFDSEQDCFHHFHIHAALIMGEGKLKSLHLPLEALYLSRTLELGGVPYVTPELEFVVLLIRMAVKRRRFDFLSRFLPKVIPASDKRLLAELEMLKERCSRSSLIQILSERELAFISKEDVLLAFDQTDSFNSETRGRIRQSISGFFRFSSSAGTLLLAKRNIQRRFFGIGKTLTQTGKSFAFCGADGSGKSTALKAVRKRLSPYLRVSSIYLGGSRSSKGLARWCYRLIVFPPFAVLRRLLELVGGRQGSERLRRLFYGYQEFLVTSEKARRFRFSQSCLKTGRLVLFDRFPLFPGAGDRGPIKSEALWLESQRKVFESFDYPDRLFCFRVEAQTAILRKPEHSSEVVTEKVKEFNSFFDRQSTDRRFVMVDAELPLEIKVIQILAEIMEALRSDP